MTDSPELLQPWQVAWRDGILPGLSDAALRAVKVALEGNDSRLIQGRTTMPGSPARSMPQPLEGACLLAYGGWQGHGLKTQGQVETFFARLCLDADFRLGESLACRRFLNHFDSVPREQMRREMLVEVTIALVARGTTLQDDMPEADVPTRIASRPIGTCAKGCA